MRIFHGHRSASVVGLCALGLASAAYAAPGEGIRVGDAVVHPSLTTGLEYHSNVYQSEGVFATESTGTTTVQGTPEIPALMFYLRPRVSVALDGEKLKLDFDGGYGLKKFIDLNSADDTHPEALDRFSDVDANFGVDAFPSGRIGLRLRDKFALGGTVSELPAADDAGEATVVHLQNNLNAGLPLRPGSALELYPKGHFGFDDYRLPGSLFDDSTTDLPTYFNNRFTYGPGLEATWKFLPRTSFLVSAGVDWLSWDNHILDRIGPEITGSTVGDYIGKADSVAWRARVGLKGQVTEKIAIIAMAGFGQAYYDEQSVLDDRSNIQLSNPELAFQADGQGEDFARDLSSFSEGLLIDLQLAYAPLEKQKITAGYRKDFADSVFSNYSLYNYWYLRYGGVFATKLNLGAEAGYRIDAYHGEIHRDDQSVVIKASGAYAFTNWMSVGLQGGWSRRACLDSRCENDQYYTIQYDDFSAQVGVTFKY